MRLDRYAAYEEMDDYPLIAGGPYAEEVQMAIDEIYLNMNGRLVRVVEEGPVRHAIGDVFVTKLMEDMWTGRIFKPEDSNDVYILRTFDCEMEVLAFMRRGPLDDE